MRRNDPANVQREEVLNSLDQACNKYEEISANIAEGVSFYARVSEVMDQFKAKVPSHHSRDVYDGYSYLLQQTHSHPYTHPWG